VRLKAAAEAYAMPVEHVLEVGTLGQVTPVPGTRRELLGVKNLRGQVLPVFDMALLLGVQRTAPPSHLLVAEAGQRRVGFAIDAVSGIGDLPEPTEDTESDLLAGAVLSGNELIGLIDTARVFDSLERTPP
jgi:chemotaxis signal transduction protein